MTGLLLYTMRADGKLYPHLGSGITPPNPQTYPPSVTLTVNSQQNRVVSVTATATSSTGTITGYTINWGDGSTVQTGTATHTYTADGTYSIVATATDDSGLTGSATRSVTVLQPTTPPPTNNPPKAAIALTQSNMSTTYSMAGSTDSDGDALSYVVDWGDGTPTSSGVTNSHTYATVGPWTVTGTATDSKGASSTVTATATPTSGSGGGGGGGGSTANAVKSPWVNGVVTEGLPSSVPVYKARTLIPSGTLELQSLINALPASGGVIDISGQTVNISTFGNGSSSGAYAAKWQGLIGGITGGAFDNLLQVGAGVMSSSIVSSIQSQQTAFTTSQYAAVRMAGGKQPFYWMGVHMIGADQGQITESSKAQISPIPARYKGVDFDVSGTGSIIQNSLFEGVNAASGSSPPWEVGALDFRRSQGQIMRRVEVSGILPVGSPSRPNASSADPYGRNWKRSGGIQFNADKSPRLTDVSLHDTIVSGLTFSIASTGNNGSNNTEDIQGTRLYLENNSQFNFADINNEVVLGPVAYDHCTFKSYSTNAHIKIANNSGFGSVAPNIPTDQFVVTEPVWSGGPAGAMFTIAISTAAQTSAPKVIVNGTQLTGVSSTGQDPTRYYYIQKV